MSIRIVTIAAATAALLAGDAGAQTTSEPRALQGGQMQLALKAGVTPGRYSLSQFVQLIEAQELNQTNRVNFILRQPFGATSGITIMAARGRTATFGTGVHSDANS